MLFSHGLVPSITLMITGQHHYSQQHRTLGHNAAAPGRAAKALMDIHHPALPDTLWENTQRTPCHRSDASKMSTLVVKRSQMQQGPSFFSWKGEQDKSAKWKGSCVSTLIMVVWAITASARLIGENVFSPQIDRSRDGENPLDPAKMWSVCSTSALDKNVPLSHTGAEQQQQQQQQEPGWAAQLEKVPLSIQRSGLVCRVDWW